MNINKIIGNIIRILVIPKIFFYRVFHGINFPIGSIIYGYPKIRNGKFILLGKGFQIGRLCRLMGNIEVGKNFFLNEFGTISAGISHGKIIIGDNVMIGPLFYMISGDHGFGHNEQMNISDTGRKGDISIGNNVWIGARVTVLKGITIGDNVVIGAGSVVVEDIPANTLAVGNPCRVKKNF